jgi:hypothetical protein
MSSTTFSSVVFLVLGHPEHFSSSTDTRLALKSECHSNNTVQLKEYSQKQNKLHGLSPRANYTD